MCACMLSHLIRVQLFAAPWTVARQAPSIHGILQARTLEWVAMPSRTKPCKEMEAKWQEFETFGINSYNKETAPHSKGLSINALLKCLCNSVPFTKHDVSSFKKLQGLLKDKKTIIWSDKGVLQTGHKKQTLERKIFKVPMIITLLKTLMEKMDNLQYPKDTNSRERETLGKNHQEILKMKRTVTEMVLLQHEWRKNLRI